MNDTDFFNSIQSAIMFCKKKQIMSPASFVLAEMKFFIKVGTIRRLHEQQLIIDQKDESVAHNYINKFLDEYQQKQLKFGNDFEALQLLRE
jgi:hypothetical protein